MKNLLNFGFGLAVSLAALRAGAVDFVHEVAPVLKEHCGECHLGDKKKGGLSMNSRDALMHGGENGAVVVAGEPGKSKLLALVTSKDEDEWMPPKGKRVPAEKVEKLRAWIAAGAKWEDGFSFSKSAYEAPLALGNPAVPKAVSGRVHPVDCFLDSWVAAHKKSRPEGVGDAEFLRRASLDLNGLLPSPEALKAFVADQAKDKRAKVIAALLADELNYTEHWLTFWNDLLRNDYSGTGYIDGGRKQISAWLYRSLLENKPYDQFARELISAQGDADGYAKGIKWRGVVSAGQSVPIQYAQSIGQSFLGINLKCASCHDSFVDRWKLSESYGLAAVYSAEPLELYRCDVKTGKMATPGWLFPEMGNVDASKPPAERMKQLAALMTDKRNGHFSRAIVNRIWHRLMGRGLVHPVDSMAGEPWYPELLEHLASRFVADGYDVKKLIAYICTSEAYQSMAEVIAEDEGNEGKYVYAGPRAKRLTAEQFVDAVWQITGTAPKKFDAPVMRAKVADPAATAAADGVKLNGQWIWWNAGTPAAQAGEAIVVRKSFELAAVPDSAVAAVSADNGYTLFVNGKKVQSGANWEKPDSVALTSHLKKGANEILIIVTNGGSAPNPAAVFFEARIKSGKLPELIVASDTSWEWSKTLPNAKGAFGKQAPEWKPAVVMKGWDSVTDELKMALLVSDAGSKNMVRASLLKSDLLMRSLGRPNREQIVSMRPNNLTTLEAMDLNNGQLLDTRLQQGAQNLVAKNFPTNDALIDWLYSFALAREPTRREKSVALEVLGEKPAAPAVQDLVWAVLMLPEFQLVR